MFSVEYDVHNSFAGTHKTFWLQECLIAINAASTFLGVVHVFRLANF